MSTFWLSYFPFLQCQCVLHQCFLRQYLPFPLSSKRSIKTNKASQRRPNLYHDCTTPEKDSRLPHDGSSVRHTAYLSFVPFGQTNIYFCCGYLSIVSRIPSAPFPSNAPHSQWQWRVRVGHDKAVSARFVLLDVTAVLGRCVSIFVSFFFSPRGHLMA